MKKENIGSGRTAKHKPADILEQFVSLFQEKGWLNQNLQVAHLDKTYSVYCSKNEFIAYRINDNWGISQGIPGWPVCIVDGDQVVEDSQISDLASCEPSARDWLCSFSNGDYKIIV